MAIKNGYSSEVACCYLGFPVTFKMVIPYKSTCAGNKSAHDCPQCVWVLRWTACGISNHLFFVFRHSFWKQLSLLCSEGNSVESCGIPSETSSAQTFFIQKFIFFGPWSKHERCNVNCKSAIYIQTCNFQKCKMYTFECAFVVNMHFSYYTKNTLKSALCTFQNCSFECKLHFKSKFCIFEKCTFECRLGFRSAIFMCSFCFKTSMLVMCFLWDCVFAKKHA